MAESQPKFVKWILAEEIAVAESANMRKYMTHVTMSEYIICNEHIMKTSSTCVFLVKSKCDNTQISVFCHLFLLPTHHDAPAQIIMENLCSWLVSVGYTVFLSWSTWAQSPLCPSHSKMLWWFWHHQLQATAPRHGGGVTSAASHTGHNSHYDQWFVKYCNVKFIPRGSHNWISLQRFS